MPSRLPADVHQRLARIRLLVLDVDGVLTDGTLIYSSKGEDVKRFSVRDGIAMRLLLKAGVQVAVLSGRSSEAVAVRCRELGLLTAYEYKQGKYLYDDPGLGLVDRISKLKMNAHFTASHTTKEVQYAT